MPHNPKLGTICLQSLFSQPNCLLLHWYQEPCFWPHFSHLKSRNYLFTHRSLKFFCLAFIIMAISQCPLLLGEFVRWGVSVQIVSLTPCVELVGEAAVWKMPLDCIGTVARMSGYPGMIFFIFYFLMFYCRKF